MTGTMGNVAHAESAENAERARENRKTAVPRLRFKGCEGGWTKERLSKSLRIRRGLTYRPSDMVRDGVRVLRSSNIDVDTFAFQDDDVFVRESAVNIPFVENGQILITAANGSTNLVGKHAVIQGVGKSDAVAGGFMLLGETETPNYVNSWMSAPWYRRFRSEFVMGGNGSLGNLNKTGFDLFEAYTTQDVNEKALIGKSFDALDSLLRFQNRHLSSLRQLKRAMLVKMFPRPGQRVPEIRFKGFKGEWEENAFEEVFQRTNAKKHQILASECSEVGDFPVVDQGQEYIIGYSNNAKKVFRASSDPVIVFGDHTRTVKIVDFDFIVGADGTQLLRSAENDVYFAYYSMSSVTLPNMGYSRHFKFLLDITWKFPALPEQRKIAAFFRNLDRLIGAAEKKVAKLRQVKASLLERMFV